MINQQAPTTSPTKPGWHLVRFLNGSAAIVRWDNQLGAAGPAHAWQWGSVSPPQSPITGFSYLGANVSDVLSHPGRLTSASAGLPAAMQASIAHAADNGVFGLKGQPQLFDAQGHTAQSQTGSEANAINQLPSPIPPNASLPNVTGDLMGVAVRVLEAVGGVLLLVIGLRALMGGDSPTVALARTAAKVAR